MNRNRLYYVLLIVVTVMLGLTSRHFTDVFPQWVRSYLGDVLWALMVFWIFGFFFNRKGSLTITIYAMVFSFAIEISQLYHAPWIDFVRNTKIGGLVLGFGFLWSDLICYSIGIGCVYFLESIFLIVRKDRWRGFYSFFYKK